MNVKLFLPLVAVVLIFSIFANGQKNLKYADDFLLTENRQPTKAMLLGVWHFDYPNADSHKTSDENMVDVLTPKRQKEIIEVVNLLKRFKPTKIYLESGNQDSLDKLFESYKQGEQKGNGNEVVQLGMRLADLLKHDRVYAVDATNYAFDNGKKYPEIDGLWDEKYQLDLPKYEEYDKAYSDWNNYSNSLLKNQTILQQLVYENNPRNLKRAYGQYMVSGWLKTSNNNGPDALALQWYNRNLRIFNNIMKTNPTAKDRILVIFGRGHIPLLQHSFEASPEFELVSFHEFAKKGMKVKNK
jgi:Family of unknown function (DUF5694)